VKGPNRIGIQPVPEHDIAVHLTHAEERGEDLPIYITLGASPLMEIAASMPIGCPEIGQLFARFFDT